MDAALAENFMFQVRNLQQSVPVWCLLLIARHSQKKSMPSGEELAQDCQGRGTDYLLIILTPWGEGEISWSCNVTFDLKHFLHSTFFFLSHCTLRHLIYVAH